MLENFNTWKLRELSICNLTNKRTSRRMIKSH